MLKRLLCMLTAATLVTLLTLAASGCEFSVNAGNSSDKGGSSGSITEPIDSSDTGDSGETPNPPAHKECSVSFDSDGGGDYEIQTVKQGEKIIEPKKPNKNTVEKQYEFLGWFNGDQKWNFENDMVNSDIVLTAKYKLIGDFTIGFNPKK